MRRRSYGMVSFLWSSMNWLQGGMEILSIFRRFDSIKSPDKVLRIVNILWDVLPSISTGDQTWISDAQKVVFISLYPCVYVTWGFNDGMPLSSCGVSFKCNCEDALGIPHFWNRRRRHYSRICRLCGFCCICWHFLWETTFCFDSRNFTKGYKRHGEWHGKYIKQGFLGSICEAVSLLRADVGSS